MRKIHHCKFALSLAPHLTWLPCQRELACGKTQLYQILVYSATPTTPQSCKPYLPSRLRDRRPDYLHFHKHRQIRTIPRPALSKIQIRAESATTIIHYSSFIIHYSLPPPHLYHQCTISIPLVISIHGNYFHRIYYFCISHNIP